MEWDITIGSDIDKDDLIADIFCDNQHIIEISQENGYYEISFNNNLNKDYPLDAILEMIKKATDRLDKLKKYE